MLTDILFSVATVATAVLSVSIIWGLLRESTKHRAQIAKHMQETQLLVEREVVPSAGIQSVNAFPSNSSGLKAYGTTATSNVSISERLSRAPG
jgi:hypothetical protein